MYSSIYAVDILFIYCVLLYTIYIIHKNLQIKKKKSKRKRKENMITIANLVANFFIFSLALLMFTVAAFLIYVVASEWLGHRKWR